MIYSHNGETETVLCEVGAEAEGIFFIDETDAILYDVQTTAVETTECRA